MNGSLLLGIGMEKNVLYCLTTTSISLLAGSFNGTEHNSSKNICYNIWFTGTGEGRAMVEGGWYGRGEGYG